MLVLLSFKTSAEFVKQSTDYINWMIGKGSSIGALFGTLYITFHAVKGRLLHNIDILKNEDIMSLFMQEVVTTMFMVALGFYVIFILAPYLLCLVPALAVRLLVRRSIVVGEDAFGNFTRYIGYILFIFTLLSVFSYLFVNKN